ncbi:tRNA (cytidine(56)-2'-O)-methyltransferase [Candidatus Bathyarchaeota archaeon]|nr:MAG: tRNA (cytidine(56)-2'-O)-methyltransferase [Candidatus Bathyarchaeota archaeon]
MKREVYILRLNHRSQRDKRVTTHLFLAARALGASGGFYSGEKDEKVERSIGKVCRSWGGEFRIAHVPRWRKKMHEWKKRGGEIVHLTMYGLPIAEVIGRIRRSTKSLLVVVGGAKVPRKVYELADWNIAVTSQPHSEISALALFLHELFEGNELSLKFKDAKIMIVPQKRGKKVLKLKSQSKDLTNNLSC